MAETAFRKVYIEEFIDGLEERMSWLRKTVTTKAQIKGNTATFLVADSGNATAVTRGANGLIPARADNLTQNEATLVEFHDLPRKTSFSIDLSQGDQRQIMQKNSMGVINRRIDKDIITALDGATINTTPAQIATVALVNTALAELATNDVKIEDEDNMFGVVTPSFYQYLAQTPEWSSVDYVDMKWFSGKQVRLARWNGVNWIRHSGLTGRGTNSAKCYIYHKDSIGHAMDKSRVSSTPGYNEEQDYHWVRTSAWFGSKLLLNNAIVQVLHDDSAHNLS